MDGENHNAVLSVKAVQSELMVVNFSRASGIARGTTGVMDGNDCDLSSTICNEKKSAANYSPSGATAGTSVMDEHNAVI